MVRCPLARCSTRGRSVRVPALAVLTLLLAAVTPAAFAPPATATVPNCVVAGTNGEPGILINGYCSPVVTAPGAGDHSSGGSERLEYRSVICAKPAGSGSGPAVTKCIAPATCPDGVTWQTEVLWHGTWRPVGAPWCPQGGNAPAPPQPSAAQIRQHALRLLPHVAIGSAPDGAGLTNAETVLWADTGSDRSLPTVTIVGQQVELRISFDHAAWNFGDGTSDTTDSPGQAYDEATDPCETAQCPGYYGHTYTATGQVTVTLTVAWHAQYRLAGQNWTDVDSVPLTGPPEQQSLTIRQARGVLIH